MGLPDEPGILRIPEECHAQSCREVPCILRPVEEVVDVRGLVGTGKQVEHLPQGDFSSHAPSEIGILVIGAGNDSHLGIRHEQVRKMLLLRGWQVLVHPALPEELCELALRHGAFPVSLHEPQVLLHVVSSEEIDCLSEHGGSVHDPETGFVSVRGDTQVAAYHVLEPDEDPELLRCFLGIEVLLVIGPDPSDGEVEPASVDVLMDGRDLETEHHPFVVDGFVRFQQLADRLVDSLRDPSLDDVRDPDDRIRDLLVWEDIVCGLLDGLDETLVGDGHLVVLGEDRDDAVFGEVGERGFLGVGLDEGKDLGLLHRDYLECGCGLDIGHNRHERRSVVDGLDSCFHNE